MTARHTPPVDGVTGRKLDALKKLGWQDEELRPFEEHLSALEKIRAQRYEPGRALELELEDLAKLQESLSAAETSELDAKRKPLVEQLGDARAKARAEIEKPAGYETDSDKFGRLMALTDRARRATETATIVGLIRDVDDPGQLVEFLEDAELSGDTHAFRAIGLAVNARIRQLAAAAHEARDRNEPTWVNPFATVRTQIAQRLATWRAAHPSPSVRIATLQRQIEATARDVSRKYAVARDLMKIDDAGLLARGIRPKRAQRTTSGMPVEGSAFERT